MLCSCGGGSSYDSQPYALTLNGVRVKKAAGVTLDAAMLNRIDVGVIKAVTKARCKGYTKELEMRDFTVALTFGYLENGVWVIKLPCEQYCGTVWDKGGYITASGQYLVNEDILLIPQQPDPSTAVHNEAEHRILFMNDKAEYNRTFSHLNGIDHPIIPECNK